MDRLDLWTIVVGTALLGAGGAGRLEQPELFLNSGCAQTTHQLFTHTCATAGCHAPSFQAGGLDLGSPGVASRLIGVPSGTCPGQTLVRTADQGFLFEKVEGSPSCGG